MQLILSVAAASRLALLPGCPVESDEDLGSCMIGKSAWAYSLYKDGLVDGFITSGGAVHTPYNEAVAGAMALEAMGADPADIWLDPMALHSDENAWNGMLIAEKLGATLVVASSRGQAAGICAYVRAWERPCEEAPMSFRRVGEIMDGEGQALLTLRVPQVESFRTIEDQELERFEETGFLRPPSSRLYVQDSFRNMMGNPRTPYNGAGIGEVVHWPSVAAAAPAGGFGPTAGGEGSNPLPSDQRGQAEGSDRIGPPQGRDEDEQQASGQQHR